VMDAGETTRSEVLGGVSLSRNVLANWAAMGFSIVATFFITPIVVGALQKELYGVWSFLNGLLVYSDLLYLGLGAALIRSVAAHRAYDHQAGVNRVASAVLSIYLVAGLLCFSAFGFLSPFVPRFFAHPLVSADAESAASYACMLLGVQLLASFAGSAFSGVLYGLDRLDLVGFIRILTLVGRTIAIVALIDGPSPLVVLATVMAVGAIFETAGLACLAFLVERRLAIALVVPTREELRALYGFGLQSFVVIFAMTLISYTDTTVIGVVIGAASVALYSLPLQLVEYIRIAAGGVSGVWFPRLTVMSERGDVEGLRTAYLTITRVTMFLATFFAANILFLGAPFLSLWVGPEFGRNIQWIIACLSSATLLHIFAITGPMGFYQAMGTLRVPAVVLLLEALANLVLSLVLASRLGILGVAVGTLVPAIVVGCLVLPPYLWKNLGLRSGEVYRTLAPSLALLVVTSAVLWGLQFIIGSNSYVLLVAKTLLTVPPMALVFFALFPRDDRVWFMREVRRMTDIRSRFAAVLAARAERP
jgi:O-antigen/teichoic acid export membrane protein